MGTAKHIGRIDALAVAPGIRNVQRNATRMTVSIGVAVLAVMATVVPVPVSTVSPAVQLSADSTALIVCGTTCPTTLCRVCKNQFIAPTHPGQDIEYVAVTTPEEFWPITGLFRLLGSRWGPRASSGLVAQRGRTSRCGSSQGSSTSPAISRCRPGWPISRRRWPSTPTTIW